MVVGEHAVKAAAQCYLDRTVSINETASSLAHAMLTAALPFLPLQGAVQADAFKLIERMAFGYEVMFEKLCHISGTSGVDQSWYRAKAREATERLSPLHSIATESNKSVPGDCKRQYKDFMSRILSALEPSAALELALEEILREVDEIERKVWAWSGSAFLNNELEGAEDADCKTELYSELCRIGNAMHWLRTKICVLSSPDHADAGKVEGDGWLPIESAPKDGAEILAWRKDCGWFIASFTSCSAFPLSQSEIDELDEETLFKEDWFTQWPQALRLEGSEEPTHWRPLPSAPSQEVAGS